MALVFRAGETPVLETVFKEFPIMRMPLFLASVLYRNSVYRVTKNGRVVEEIPFREGKIHGTRKKYSYENCLESLGFVSVMTPYNMGKREGMEVRYMWDVNESFFLSRQSQFLPDKIKQEIPYVDDKISGMVKVYFNDSLSSWRDCENENVVLIECDCVKNGKLNGESTYIETRPVKCHSPYWKIKRKYEDNNCIQYNVYVETNSIEEAWEQQKVYIESAPSVYVHSYYNDGTIKTELDLKENVWTTYYPSGKIKTKCIVNAKGKTYIERFYETGEIFSSGILYRDVGNGKKNYKVNLEHSIHAFKQENVSYFAKNGTKLSLDSSEYRIERLYYESGSIKSECPIINGKKEGMEVAYNECGFLSSETPFVDGKEDGTAYSYYGATSEENLDLVPYCGIIAIDQDSFLAQKYLFEKGALKHTVRYVPVGYVDEEIINSDGSKFEDLISGTAKKFFPNGCVKAEYSWNNGKISGKYVQYYLSGNKFRDAFFENGLREGEVIEYYNTQEGRKKVRSVYRNDLLDGQKIAFDYNGNIALIYNYKAGRLTQIHNKVSKQDGTEVWAIADVNDIKHNMFGGKFEYTKVSVVKEDGTIEKSYNNLDVRVSMGHINTNYAVNLNNDEEYALYRECLLDRSGQIILSGEFDCGWFSSQDLFDE